MKLSSKNSRFKNVFANEKGSVLLTVLVLLLIFAIIGSAVLVTTVNNLYVSRRMSEYEDIYYVAESNAQFALTYLKEEITDYYVFLQNIAANQRFAYERALEDFYPTISAKIIFDPDNPDQMTFVPLDFSDQGITTTVTFTIDDSTPIPTSGFGEDGNTVRFLIESVAETDTSRRVVHAVLEVDDPDVSWKMTSAPPMTDMRMLIGDEIVLTDDLQHNEYNSIFCRGSALIAYAFVPQFLTDHQEFLNTYSYDFSNAVPSMLEWDLKYDKFPPHAAFDTFESLFKASTPGTAEHDSFYDWEYRTINYSIEDYAPATYPNSQIIDSQINENDVDFYFTQSTIRDTRTSNRYVGTESNPVRVYAVGNMIIRGNKDLENCYIYAEGYIHIDIDGHIKNAIIISNGGNIEIDCDYIKNDDHMLIKSKYDLDIRLDRGALMENVVARSRYGELTVYNDSHASRDKIVMKKSYLHTNKYDKDAMIYLRNVFADRSYVSAGKDLILRNCSGYNSSLYAFGTTDSNINQYGRSYLYTSRCYNDYMQYYCNNRFHRWYRGIVVISELAPRSNTNYLKENAFTNCDFVTGESIFLCDPYYYISNGNQLVDLRDCRIIADREVLIEDVTMNGCYVFAGIRGYENEQSIFYRYGVPKLYVVRGIHMRVDHTHNEIEDCVFYSKGRMMYSQHTPESYGYPITEAGKVRVYSSFFYSINNFEYNGISTSEGLDTTIMRNNSDLCNNMIIMTEGNLGPHEYSPSVANDVVFIGGDLELDPERPHFSGTLFRLIGGEAVRGRGDSIDIQCEHLYDNYFEQLLSLDEIEREIPGYSSVFVYEDIYEKKEAGNGG